MSKQKGEHATNRKRKIRSATIAILILICVWFYSTFTLAVTHETISDEKINGPVTIVHISDLHGVRFGRDNADLVKAVKRQKPDLIAVTGDMYTHGDEKGKQTAISLMTQLTEIAPVYFVNGEHDHGETFAAELEEHGVNALRYEDEVLEINGTPIHLYGITNVYYSGTFDLANAFEPDDASYCVLLAHIENFSKFSQFGIDLSLCGDTHGGQIRLPLIGALYLPGEGIFPDLSGRFVKGMYCKGDSLMHVSGGLGNYPFPIRFCNRPEITVITLTPAS